MLWPFPATPNNQMKHALTALAIMMAPTAATAAPPSFDCVIDPSEVLKLGSPITGILAQVLVKRGGLWRITDVQNTNSIPETAFPPPQ